MKKVVSADFALSTVKSGMTVMIGGSAGNGMPESLVRGLLERDLHGLTIITSDISIPESAIVRLIDRGKVAKLVATHIGHFPHLNELGKKGELEVMIIPKGTMVELLRAGRVAEVGETDSGQARVAKEAKKIVRIDGRQCLLPVPLRAEVALIKAFKSDIEGNLIYRREARNFNPIMAAAADIVVAETEYVVDKGLMDKDEILTAGARVKYVVIGGVS